MVSSFISDHMHEIRMHILDALKFIPDKQMICLQYRIKTGRSLQLKNPSRYSEKIQLYKLRYRSPLMTRCADKYTVRNYIKECGFEDILIPIYGVYDAPSYIDFDAIDEPSFIKCTSSSHGNYFYLPGISSKSDCVKKLNKDFNRNFYTIGREWAYKNSCNKVIAEKCLEKDRNGHLDDYKFFCFDGAVKLVYVCSDRDLGGHSRITLYDRNFRELPVSRKGIAKASFRDKPINYDQMIEIAETLSKPFPHVRVDFYNIDGKIWFGEMTFYTASGYLLFDPDSFDSVLGSYFNTDFE